MALIKLIETDNGLPVSYWKIVAEQRHRPAAGLVIDVTLAGWIDAGAFGAGRNNTGVMHEFRITQNMLGADKEPTREALYEVIKEHDTFFEGATDDLVTKAPPPPPPPEPLPDHDAEFRQR